MASKWAKLKGKYEETPFSSMTNARDQKFRDKVVEAKLEFSRLTQTELFQFHLEAKNKKDELDEQIDQLNVDLEALGQLIRKRFTDDGVNSVKTATGRTIYLEMEPYVSVKDKAEFDKFMAEHAELDYMYSVNPQTLASFVKDLLDQDRDSEVPGCLEIFLKTSVRNRKS